MKKYWTIGIVAKIFGISSRTAVLWFDRGHFDGYRIPGGSHDRRVVPDSVLRFAVEQKLPDCIIDEIRLRIGGDPSNNFDVFYVADNPFEAWSQFVKYPYFAVVLNSQRLGVTMTIEFAKAIRCKELRCTIGVIPADDNCENFAYCSDIVFPAWQTIAECKELIKGVRR